MRLALLSTCAALLGALLTPCAALAAGPAALSGAGSSAAAPVYRAWSAEYAQAPGGTELAYEPAGSSAGMARIRARQVDFGASDIVDPRAELERDGLVMFPTVVTGIVPVVNLPRIGDGALRLTGPVLAEIFLGKLTQWDAAAIRALNPGVDLPSLPIRRVVRADGSGTTYHFADYLARVSPAWKQQHGVANKIAFSGEVLAVKGSGEVAKAVRATPGAIGYIDFNYVVDEGLAGVQLRNADGHFLAAGPEGFRAAVARSPWFTSGDFTAEINDSPGAKAWPITMGTYVALPRVAKDSARTEQALRFIVWAYLNGDALARHAKFVPLPAKVQASAYREISRVTGAQGEPLGLKVLGSLMQ